MNLQFLSTILIRSLQLVSSKLSCLSVLEWLSARVSSEIICERILPQLIFYLSKNPKNQNVPAVMTRAISVLVTSTGHVKHVSMSDAKTWPEYILPALSELSQHPEIKVEHGIFNELRENKYERFILCNSTLEKCALFFCCPVVRNSFS